VKFVKKNLFVLLALLVVGGAIYTFGVGHPVVVAIQFAMTPIIERL
jgi:hypothetical protein